MNLEEIIKNEYGFESLVEFNKLVSSVDLSTPEKIKYFTNWKQEDGSKIGLLLLIEKIGKI